MSDNTKIEWTEATWNPIRGCSRVSQGCVHCYAEGVARRFSGPGKPYEGLINKHGSWSGNITFVEHVLDQPLRWRRPRRIFVNSMSDLFHENVTDEQIDKIFSVMARAQQHTFQILTKRPERMRVYLSDSVWAEIHGPKWPLPNVWLGVSVENQEAANKRIPLLLQTPAAIRFLSCEPLLGQIDLSGFFGMYWNQTMQCWESTGQEFNHLYKGKGHVGKKLIDWVIAGGESGHGARPMHPDWVRSLRDQCRAAGVPFFFKQWGNWRPLDWDNGPSIHDWFIVYPDGDVEVPDDRFPHAESGEVAMYSRSKKSAGRLLDGRTWDEYPEVRNV